jgi:hypothetical protein
VRLKKKTSPSKQATELLQELSNIASSLTTMSAQVEDKNGNPIDEGDRVFTKIRGGKREGEVRISLSKQYIAF